MDRVDHKTQEHDTDACFDCHVGQNVDRFAKPPELWTRQEAYHTYFQLELTLRPTGISEAGWMFQAYERESRRVSNVPCSQGSLSEVGVIQSNSPRVSGPHVLSCVCVFSQESAAEHVTSERRQGQEQGAVLHVVQSHGERRLSRMQRMQRRRPRILQSDMYPRCQTMEALLTHDSTANQSSQPNDLLSP